MATLLEIKNVSKRYSDQLLLDDASVAVPANCKMGMVGRNGAGKSTLCRVLIGSEELDSGHVVRHPRLRLGYLRQHDPFRPGETVINFLMRDSGQPDWRCGEVAAEFAIKGPQLDRPVSELSGGWQTRAKLAALLLHDPNLLLMDEPTNFLDLRTQLLLQNFLKHFGGGILIVSHDRGFLKATCTHTLELSRGKLTLFPSDIEQYIEHKYERREHDRRVNATTLAKQKQLQRFIEKNRGSPSTSSQARSKQKQLDRLQLIDIEADEKTVRFHVPQGNIRRGTAVRCRDLAIGYEDHTVASDINLEIEHGTCTVVVGDNGQGKTTILRTLVDSLPTLAGEVRWGHGCEIGVYAQHVYSTLPERKTILEYLDDCRGPDTTTQTVLDIAGSFLFSGEHINKHIEVLSGGERARVCLAGLLLSPHNVLVLDEPANHLDVETVDALCVALGKYEGTIVLTSHDRHFVHRVADSVIEIGDGKATHYQGDYDTYLYRVQKEAEGESAAATARAGGAQSGTARPASRNTEDRQQRKKEAAQKRSAQRRVATLERKIAQLDDRKRSLNGQLLSTTDAAEAQRLHDEMQAVQAEIETAEQQWFELQEGQEEA